MFCCYPFCLTNTAEQVPSGFKFHLNMHIIACATILFTLFFPNSLQVQDLNEVLLLFKKEFETSATNEYFNYGLIC